MIARPVSIFRRKKAATEVDPTLDEELDGPSGELDPSTEAVTEVVVDRTDGPFDVSEVEGADGRLELGALWVRGIPGMELRLEVDQDNQQVNAVTAAFGDSAIQLQAFAAPRTAGVWDEIRAEIAEAIERQGGTVETHEGVLGRELRTRMPSAGPDGRTVFAPATFIGVDGPRWFLRGVLSGRAAIDQSAAGPLVDLLRATVVVRGDAPMAPRELLTLTLPSDVSPAGADTPEEPAPAEDLNPFERGPEITEVR